MLPDRKNTRLHGYDYSSIGSYFITICTHNREYFFGEIENKKFEFSPIGAIAYIFWNEIPRHFPQVRLGEFVIMPNHIHGIIEIVNDDFVGSRHGMSLQNHQNKFGKTIPGSISAIIGQFKSAVTRWCNKNGFNFAWQSRFYDNVIRSHVDYERIENYILNNVAYWEQDKFSNDIPSN
jgi:REP element-mobilizing transposase RayT